MIEKVMKVVKSSNKRRGRNITIGAVIGFLLSCTTVMGADNYLWIKKDSGAIEFNTQKTTAADGSGGTWSEENPYENAGNIWKENTYTNNMTLSSNGANGKEQNRDLSYGLRLSGNLTGVNLINNGLITGIIGTTGDKEAKGYGIYNNSSALMGNITNAGVISGTGINSGSGIYNSSLATIGNIENTGIISGTGINSGSGNGIYNNSSATIGNIANTGIISGTGTNSGSGSGIYNTAAIGNIANIGIISGSSGFSAGFGYGIYSNSSAAIGNIVNTGVISGSGTNSGYGIYSNSSAAIGNITNIGVISGTGKSTGDSYGICNIDYDNKDNIRNITNTGVISGTSNSTGSGIRNVSSNNNSKLGNITNIGIISGTGKSTGYGIDNANSSPEIEVITNIGVIYGKTNAIKGNYKSNGYISTVNNYGILLNGSDQDVNTNITISNNYGLIIKNNGKGKIEAGTAGTQDISIPFYDAEKNIMGERKVKIENKDAVNGNDSFDGNKENHILNALTNTYKVTDKNDEAKVTGSIVNAYGTAIVFEGKDKKLTLSGTIVNGGIDESDPDTKGIAISGSNNGDTLILQSGKIKYTDDSEVNQNTVVNGNINMGAGADTLTIGDGTIINGTIDGGDSDFKDTLNFGISSVAKSNPAESQEIKIMHNISNFENMNINTNVTLFEKTIDKDRKETNLKVTGAEKITIGENGTLTLRIDSTNKENLNGIDKIIGHALYENAGTISSEGGKLILALNGAGNQSIISFGNNILDSSLIIGDTGTFDTNSKLHTIFKISENEVKITVRIDIPEILKYKELNKIYHGILSVDDLIGNFYVNSNESLSVFLGYLNDIYAGNPYSYSSELSRKSVGMFRDIATENQFKPELNKWSIMGGLTHVDGGTKDTYYGKGYYTYDIGSVGVDADTKITGAYMLGEYGVSDTLTYGVLIGGNKLKSDFSNGSKVDGDALYMGAYAKKYVGNLKVTGGLGLQYGDYDADRIAAGKGITETRSYSDKYSDMTYDIYLNGRYSHNIGENLFLEPYGTLSYTYVDQEGADEGNKTLAIETDSKTFDYTAAKVGVDLKKVIPHEKGKSTLSAGVSYTRLLTGADEENITGRFKGGSDFDILVAHKNEHSIGFNAKYALELESGILFDVKGSYSVERDSHNGTGKNRNKGEWIVGAGIGYKF